MSLIKNKVKKMRIAIFTDTFTPQVNGVVTATIEMAKGLANKGHKIFIIAPQFKQAEEFKHKNVKVIRISSIPAKFYEDFKLTEFNMKLFVELKRRKIDIVHFQTPIMLGAEAIFMSKYLDVPLVGTYHTAIADPQYLKHLKLDYKIAEKMSWIYSRTFYNRCDLITCPSQSMKAELEKNGLDKNIKVISNGIDTRIFDNSRKDAVKKKYNPKGDIVLFVGRIAHEKNIIYLLECFKRVSEKMPKTKFMIIGDGPQIKDVKNKIKSLKISDKIILLGRVEHDDLVKSSIFGACKVFATASLTETQGITLLEAQANGIVGVGVDAKGTKDLIIEGYNGFLVKKGDKKRFAERIIRLLHDKKEYARMRRNTLKEIEKHNMKKVINTWEKTYLGLIKSKKTEDKRKKDEN